MSDYTIRKMSRPEVAVAVEWGAREGWNPGLHDAALFYNADPDGFFAGEWDGRIVAVGSAVCYDDAFAFCGLYIVDPAFRGRGLGLALTRARLACCGSRNVGIDGVLENVELYRRVGYAPFYQNHRFQLTAAAHPETGPGIARLTDSDVEHVLAYDRLCFPADRARLLKPWLAQPDGTSLVARRNGAVTGFAVRRKCRSGHKVGPLFADDPATARALFLAMQDGIAGETLILDVPGNNAAALDLAGAFEMEEVFATMRMYQRGLPDIDHGRVFGITTFELG